jgi:hypothetical protein
MQATLIASSDTRATVTGTTRRLAAGHGTYRSADDLETATDPTCQVHQQNEGADQTENEHRHDRE